MSGPRTLFQNRQSPRPAPARAPRGGFSLIELLVVMGIIALLIALGLPAIGRSRAAAQRVQCQNNLHQLSIALLEVTDIHGRFPACGNFGRTGPHHTWVVDVLPWIEQKNIYDRWDVEKPIGDPANDALAHTYIPLLTCPSDISVEGRRGTPNTGDLSYVVSAGIGFTAERSPGEHDCPVDPSFTRLDLNQNSVLCPQPPNLASDGDPTDRDLFFRMGLFFNETWKWDVTQRHHRIATVLDGTSQTMLLSENVRTGYNPGKPEHTWANPYPLLTSFYIGNPCPDLSCAGGVVDYSRCNSGPARINGGLQSGEGTAPYPNAFHQGGVNMAFCDGHITFLSEQVDGAVYAALASPQGGRLQGTPFQQPIVSMAEP